MAAADEHIEERVGQLVDFVARGPAPDRDKPLE